MNLKARYSQSEFDEKALSLFGADGFQANKPLDPGFVDLINFFNGTNYNRNSTWGLANIHLTRRSPSRR